MFRRTLLLAFLSGLVTATAQQPDQGWPTYGGDPGGTRFSASTQITRANLSQLRPAWTFHTHALDIPRPGFDDAAFEATPVLLDHALIFASPFDVVFAIDALSGQQLWSHDPHITVPLVDGKLATFVTSRGVAIWTSPAPTTACTSRVFLGTVDARLLALDAATGRPCLDFGQSGEIDLKQAIDFQGFGAYSVTSPPTVIGNIVIVGSSIGDNQQVDSESGLIRAFDVITGHLLWSFEPLSWARNNHPRTGAGNVWSIISADPALNLVFLPTSSASPDYYGGLRPGDNRDADSIVALDAATGRRVWAFQTVHHNLWDYDVPSEPLLFTFRPNTPQATPAIAVTTKTGQVFVLDRRTGQPLYPVEERPVPQSDVPGETSSPTQPFSALPSLSPLTLPPIDTNRSPANLAYCKDQLSKLRYDGIYTPPSTRGSLLFPGNVGGVNWGGAALDPSTGILYANVNRELFSMKLVSRHSVRFLWSEAEPPVRDWPLWIILALAFLLLNIAFRLRHSRRTPIPQAWRPSLRATIAAMLIASIAAVVCIFPRKFPIPHFGYELSPQRGTPFLIEREPVADHDGHPCVAPPWGATTALNLNTGRIAWQTPIGSPANASTGAFTVGGPIVTAGGIVFTAATDDAQLRALDAASGAILWSAPLPASARSTPMTYTLDGRQFVVIAAGGHGRIAGARGDSLIAFSLPR